MNSRHSHGWLGAAIAAGGITLGSLALPAMAQQDSKSKDGTAAGKPKPVQPVRRARPVRPAVIDLEAQAKERRPGQVMPGDGVNTAPIPRQPVPAAVTPAAPEAAPQPGIIEDIPTTSAPAMTPPSARRPGMRAEPLPAIETPAPATETPAPVVSKPFTFPSASSKPSAQIDPAGIAHEPVHEQARNDAPASQPEPAAAPVPVALDPAPTPEQIAATGIDALIVSDLGDPVSSAAAKVTMRSMGGESPSQWRIAGQAWKDPRTGDMLEGKVELRAGMDSDLLVVIDDKVRLSVSRLGRVVVERTIESSGQPIATITLARGAIEVSPMPDTSDGGLLARVKTPDQMFGIRAAATAPPVRVEYDAFTGTKRKTAIR